MRTIKTTTLLILLFISTNCFSQNVFGFVDSFFVSTDLYNGSTDTLISFQGLPWINLGFRSAIDNYNGRYFFSGTLPGKSGNLHIINLNDTSISSFSLPYLVELEYDFTRNRLLYMEGFSLYSFDLSNQQIQFIDSISIGNGKFAGKTTCYIPYTDMFLENFPESSGTPNADYYYVLFDVANKDTVCLEQILPDSTGKKWSGLCIKSDASTGEIFGWHDEKIAILDPCKGEFNSFLSIPDYYSSLNNQMAFYDQAHKLYVVPFAADTATNPFKYAFIDINSQSLLSVINQPLMGKMNLHQIYDQAQAPLLNLRDTLFVPHGKNYKWYLNGQFLSNSSENFFVPSLSGTYTVEIEFESYTSTSTPLNVTIIGIKENLVSQLELFPNPASSHVTLDVGNSKIESLKLYDLMGHELFSVQYDNTFNNIELDISSLSEGVYLIKLNDSYIKFIKN